MSVNLRRFNKDAEKNRKRFRTFISKMEKSRHAKAIVAEVKNANAEVWAEIDCLSCANCCKKMTPTLTSADKTRIAAHVGLSVPEFTNKYLEYDKKDKDWRMQKQPCVFLDLATNKCSIYAIRPTDCSGFPHLDKTPLKQYMHIHKQNIMYCPATHLFIEKLYQRIEFST